MRAKQLVILHIPGNSNPSDCFTKCLAKRKFNECSQVLLHGDDRNLLSNLSITATMIDTYDSKKEIYEMLMSVIEDHDERWEGCDAYLHIHDGK